MCVLHKLSLNKDINVLWVYMCMCPCAGLETADRYTDISELHTSIHVQMALMRLEQAAPDAVLY